MKRSWLLHCVLHDQDHVPQQGKLGSVETAPNPGVSHDHATTPLRRDVEPGRRCVNKGRELLVLSWLQRSEQLKQRWLPANLTGRWFVGSCVEVAGWLGRRMTTITMSLSQPPSGLTQLRNNSPGCSLLTYDLIKHMCTNEWSYENN